MMNAVVSSAEECSHAWSCIMMVIPSIDDTFLSISVADANRIVVQVTGRLDHSSHLEFET